MKQIPRVVQLSYHDHDRGESYFCVEDHGAGLSRDTLKAFATFGLSRKARAMERDNTDVDAPDFLSGEIGEFGVGSKQAAFFNGRCISVMTAQDSADKPCSSSVLELEIAADRMDEAYKQSQNPYAGQVNQRARGNVEQSHLSAALLQRASIRDLISTRETDLRQFTRIIVSQVSKRTDRQQSVNRTHVPAAQCASHGCLCACCCLVVCVARCDQIKPEIRAKYKKKDVIVNELCRLYQFYLYGLNGFPTEFGELSGEDLLASLRALKSKQADPLTLSVRFFKNDAPVWSCADLTELVCDPDVQVAQSTLFLLSKRGEPFCFKAKVRHSNNSDREHKQQQTSRGANNDAQLCSRLAGLHGSGPATLARSAPLTHSRYCCLLARARAGP